MPQTASGAWAGRLDPAFAGDGRKLVDFFNRDDRAEAVAVQGKKILVAGGTYKPHVGTRMTLARFRRSSRLDKRFARRGRAFVPSRRPPPGGFPRASGTARAIAFQDDGKIVIAGDDATEAVIVARFHRNGSMDRSFGRNGSVRTNPFGSATIQGVAIQPDGKIVVVGYSLGFDLELLLVRYRRNGELDPAFGDAGVILTDFGQPAPASGRAIALQPDGRIVIAGDIGNNWIVARLLENGTPDPSFSGDGIAFSAPLLIGHANDVAIRPDGKIVAAGVDFGHELGGNRFAVARYLPDGTFDPSFSGDGAQHTPIGFMPHGRPTGDGEALALLPSGRAVVAGWASTKRRDLRFALARYRPDGELDRSFSHDGKTKVGFRHLPTRKHDDIGQAVSVQRNGRIVVAGYSEARRDDKDWALARFLGSG